MCFFSLVTDENFWKSSNYHGRHRAFVKQSEHSFSPIPTVRKVTRKEALESKQLLSKLAFRVIFIPADIIAYILLKNSGII